MICISIAYALKKNRSAAIRYTMANNEIAKPQKKKTPKQKYGSCKIFLTAVLVEMASGISRPHKQVMPPVLPPNSLSIIERHFAGKFSPEVPQVSQ